MRRSKMFRRKMLRRKITMRRRMLRRKMMRRMTNGTKRKEKSETSLYKICRFLFFKRRFLWLWNILLYSNWLLSYQVQMMIIYFRPSVFLINKCHNINSSPPFVGNGNIEFRGKEASPQINCPIQTIFCSSQTWTISLENVPRALNAMNNHNQPVVQNADLILRGKLFSNIWSRPIVHSSILGQRMNIDFLSILM